LCSIVSDERCLQAVRPACQYNKQTIRFLMSVSIFTVEIRGE
jgi:hypothetical protein